jgi:hypothetical protein
MKAYFHKLEGAGIAEDTTRRVGSKAIRSIAEDKRVINAKSPWTLSHMSKSELKAYRDDPEVPPSMKTKLDSAMELKGGLAGVSKASGFIQRMMAENKKKHNGEYKKPTLLGPNSTMNKKAVFHYGKLASASQNGTNKSAYGASPFIAQHFSGATKMEDKPGETKEQHVARIESMAKRYARLAKKLSTGEEEPEEEAEAEAEAPKAEAPKRKGKAPYSLSEEDKAKIDEGLKGLEVDALNENGSKAAREKMKEFRAYIAPLARKMKVPPPPLLRFHSEQDTTRLTIGLYGQLNKLTNYAKALKEGGAPEPEAAPLPWQNERPKKRFKLKKPEPEPEPEPKVPPKRVFKLKKAEPEPEPEAPKADNLEVAFEKAIAALPTARAKATLRQRLRYWTSGDERPPVSREEGIRKVLKL